MFVRGLYLGIALIGAAAATQAVAAPHSAGATAPVASFVEVATKGASPKILYYKNEDVVKTTTTTTKTPIYTTVTTPVYKTVQQPIYNSKGQIAGYKSVQVQTGTTTSQKITGYNTVTTKSTAVTPKAELFTTANGSATAKGAAPVKFLMAVPTGSPFAVALSKPQNALFSLSAVSTTAPVLTGGTFSELFSGSLSFTATTPIYGLNAAGHAVGPALTNLLTINFTDAVFTGTSNGLTMGLAASTPASTISFTSDFRTFSRADWLTNFDFAIAGNAASAVIARALVDPTLTNVTGTRTLNSFRSNATGTFAASAVPESATWMMMIMGFAAVGMARRADVRRFARVTI
jgi:hypothetical protein